MKKSLNALSKIQAEKTAEKNAEYEEKKAKSVHEFEIFGDKSEDESDMFYVQHYLDGIGIKKDDNMKVLPYECFIN